ncbi:hypothetical protein EVC37_16175 [Methylocaldum sp. BRCS4]|jgi:hypothetical protein|uniref:hypothetical protein n=1 Tax=Methylocaldum sp. 14B TaxID=1912213 RepID=UPI00098A11CC|nr:hypothetical protein [Methylocaldum sp. 14B]MVF23139.1 hypothetical protein [Methylocaldum sp. BRCS4]
MSARYGCSTEIHLPAITSAIAASVKGLKKILKWINDAQINDESASDGTAWLNVQCPEQNCGHSFVKDLDEAIDDLAQYAPDGFAVEYVYEGDLGVDFYGSTPETKAIAKRNWNFGKAAHYLEEEGIHLESLLKIPVAAQAIVEDIKLAYGTGVGNEIDKECRDWPDWVVRYRSLAELLQNVTATNH